MISSNQNNPVIKEYRRILGGKIKALRELAGISQLELATRLDYNSDKFISDVETGRKGMKMEKIQELAKIFNVSPHFLFDDTQFTKEEIQLYQKFYATLKKSKKNPQLSATMDVLKKILG